MNLRQTAEVAAILATSAAHIVESPQDIPAETLHAYWKQSRTRLRCWFAALRTLRHRPPQADHSRPLRQHEKLVVLCREILVAEMLARVWSTLLTASDERRHSDHAAKTVDAVFRGHLEARNEVLQILASETELPPGDQISLDRFRRRIERWTDALIGPLVATYGVANFAFDEPRARDFAESALQQTLQGSAAAYAPLLLAGVSAAFPRASTAEQERASLNVAVVRAILAAFPVGAFANDGRLKAATHGQIDRSSQRPDAALSPPNDSASTQGLSFVNLRRREGRD